MQLKKISGQMSLAACALLQVTTPTAQAAEHEWKVDTATLIYSESDSRVSVFEPGLHASLDLNEDEKIDIGVVFDVLTGATPNGAHATNSTQTFTSASGSKRYTAAPGETPLDNSFQDTRLAGSIDYSINLDRMSRITWGANLSGETDYFSMGGRVNYEQDFNNRNTTLTTGLALSLDILEPTGGVPTRFAPMLVSSGGGEDNESEDDEDGEGGESDNKLTTDMIIGVTQVINRKTLLQVNYSFGYSSGYLNDPSKIVSVIDPATGLPATTGFFNTAVTDNLPYVYESRPDSRTRQSLYSKIVRHLGEDVIHLSYRYYQDDWDIKSNTLDFKYRYQMDGSYLQPHIRLYEQTAASFKRHDLQLGSDIDPVTGQVLVQYASNDYRLADSRTVTLGLKYGKPLGQNQQFSMRAEWMSQTINEPGVPEAEKTPGLDAIILQVNYSFLF